MLAPIDWLKDYVDIDVEPTELAEKLTRSGLEVESVNYLGAGIEGVVTGRVEEIYRHPNSDHLWVCSMNVTGTNERVQILTGAQNVRQYDMVPVAMVGAHLPIEGGVTMKPRKMRGLDSFGMLCSAEELGIEAKLLLPEERNGIWILPKDTLIGADIRKVMGLDDHVLDIDLTANKQDCFCMTGLAREAAAVLRKSLVMPDMSVKETAGGDINDTVTIRVEAKDLCPRFAVRMLKNIKIFPSPVWMQNHLRAAGMRPINNVVDVTNYVMLELGQPMHAYDYDTLKDHTIIVRRGRENEKFLTLDGQERTLNSDMITIADPEKAVGLGGVMGGLITEVTDKTVNVLLESASFYGPSIRRTSRALGLHSEASGRFERGVDIVLCHNALNRAAHLLEEMGACETVHGIAEDYPVEYKPAVIRVAPQTISTRIGVTIEKAEMLDILKRLEFKVEEDGEELVITAPSWRCDVTCDADISEEIARLHSYDKIESHIPVMPLTQGMQDVSEDVKDKVEDTLTAAGLNEAVTYTFVNPNVYDKMLLPQDDMRRQSIRLQKPLSDDFSVMRTSMVPSLLMAAAYNVARQAESVKLFEVGRIFLPKQLPLTDFPEEKRIVCAVMTGRRSELSWTSDKSPVDFYDMKGVVEMLLGAFKADDYELTRDTQPYYHPGKSCVVVLGGRKAGCFGTLHPAAAEAFNVPDETYVMELELEALIPYASRVPHYTGLPKYPAIIRDIAVIVPKEVTELELETLIRKSAGKYCTCVNVFDVYTGKQVSEGSKSMAFSIQFQCAERTLKDDEIEPLIKKVIGTVEETYKAQLRK